MHGVEERRRHYFIFSSFHLDPTLIESFLMSLLEGSSCVFDVVSHVIRDWKGKRRHDRQTSFRMEMPCRHLERYHRSPTNFDRIANRLWPLRVNTRPDPTRRRCYWYCCPIS